jgi:DNA modification methylase
MAHKRIRIRTASGVTETLAQKTRQRRQTLREVHDSAAHMPARRNDLAPHLKIERVPIDSLKSASRRVRRTDAAQVERVIASIRQFGLCAPLLISGDRRIVHGHVVWEAARQLGISEISCVVVDHLTEDELRILGIALNRLGERGDWDFDALQQEFEDLGASIDDLMVTGFEMPEIDMILTGSVVETPEEEAEAIPDVGTNPVSRPGDVWRLGEHKLIQGDARDPDCYSRIMNGEAARLVLTDVPYNVSIRTITGDERHREFAMGAGEMDRDTYLNFNMAWMKVAADRLVDGGLLSTAIDWRSIDVVMAAAREVKLAHINTAVWTKTNAGQGSLWRSAHELYPVFRKGTATHVNNVMLGKHGRWRSNVWTYAGGSSLGSDSREGLKLHPTVKPRALIEDVLLDVTSRGDIVIDCFAGSGSALVAAEATGRRCMAIEIDGLYCDVIIKRWQDMTGETAVLEETGESFATTAQSHVCGDNSTANRNDSE